MVFQDILEYSYNFLQILPHFRIYLLLIWWILFCYISHLWLLLHIIHGPLSFARYGHICIIYMANQIICKPFALSIWFLEFFFYIRLIFKYSVFLYFSYCHGAFLCCFTLFKFYVMLFLQILYFLYCFCSLLKIS